MQSKVSLMDLIHAGLIQPGQVLQLSDHENIQARVTPRGTVLFQGVEYNSLSQAAKAVTEWPVNGWLMWRIKTENNDLIKLSDLRDRIETATGGAD